MGKYGQRLRKSRVHANHAKHLARDLSTSVLHSSDRVILNHGLALNLVWLDKTPEPHLLDVHTRFQNAIHIRSGNAEEVWYAFEEEWA